MTTGQLQEATPETLSDEEQTVQKSTPIETPEEEFVQGVIALINTLYRVANRMNKGSPQDAEELVQDTLLKAFRFSRYYQRGTNLRAWLLRILQTTSINFYKQRSQRPTLAHLPPDDPTVMEDLAGRQNMPGAEEEFLNSRIDEEVIQALLTLPANFREVIILSDIEELSYKEIAETLTIPIGTVMSRISRGRKRLRQSLLSYAQTHGYCKAS